MLTKKYKKHLAMQRWTDEELAELGPGLRGAFEADILTMRRVERRLAFLWERIKEVVNLQDDLAEIGTEAEDYKPLIFHDMVEGSSSDPHVPR